jgi:hypothetical protein
MDLYDPGAITLIPLRARNPQQGHTSRVKISSQVSEPKVKAPSVTNAAKS